MFSVKEDTLSPDELRKRLYQTFKDKGVLDTLKVSDSNTAVVVFCYYYCKSLVLIILALSSDVLQAQLRYQLIQDLKPPPSTGGEPVVRPATVKSDSLLVSAWNYIVAEYLRSSGYEYTLSIFGPESGLGKDKVSMTAGYCRMS